MRVLRHTFNCTVPTYESLELTIDLGLTNDQIARAQTEGRYVFVLDFPNWDAVTEALEIFADDPETGESTTTPMSKPELPLTAEGISRLPVVLLRYIAGGYAVNDALADFMETTRPN